MQFTPFRIAIPTYCREDTLRQKTLAYLDQCGVPPGWVDIFVADAEAARSYRRALGPARYTLVVARPGLAAVRNYIHMYYPVGQHVFSMDDDITGIYTRVDDKHTALVTDLTGAIATGFTYARAGKARLWGIGAVLNPFFMKPDISYSLKFVVACAHGHVSTRDPALQVRTHDKDDYERTCRYYLADGAVCRLNYLAPKTRYYTEPGGMQLTRTDGNLSAAAHRIADMFPHLAQTHVRKNGRVELRLRDRRPRP